ncbi:MAG: hypothetical protein IPL40_09580 [Proteobacteria bacterium]|nr:hypothetical protein [Pseudomonadota bacterium]
MTRVLLFWSIGFVLLTLLGPLLQLFGLTRVSCDVATLIVLHVSLTAAPAAAPRGAAISRAGGWFDPAGVGVTVGLGYLADLLAGTPAGLQALALAAVYLFGRGLARKLYLGGALSYAIVGGAAALYAGIVGTLLRSVLWRAAPSGSWLLLLLAQTLLTAAAAAPLLRALARIDQALAGREALPGARSGLR